MNTRKTVNPIIILCWTLELAAAVFLLGITAAGIIIVGYLILKGHYYFIVGILPFLGWHYIAWFLFLIRPTRHCYSYLCVVDDFSRWMSHES